MKNRDKIIFDTETTGFLNPDAIELEKQPHMIEIYAARLDGKNNIVGEIDTLLSVPVSLLPIITKVTGLSDSDLAGADVFPSIYKELVELFLGARTLIGHNVSFDAGILWAELSRMGKEFHFPWPPTWYCTIEKSMWIENKRLNLSSLHEHATGHPHKEGAHRAKADVHATLSCYKWLVNENKIRGIK